VAVVLSIMVNSKINAGDIAGARNFSNFAKIISWVTIGFFVLSMAWAIYNFATNPDYMQQIINASQQGR
jgi:preprotein translocase subunit SecG